MRGFLKRDISLVLPSLWVYGAFFVLAGGLSISRMVDKAGYFALYGPIFAVSTHFDLSRNDDANRWQGYAAAIPGGRGAMVDARYAFSLIAVIVVAVMTGALALMGGEKSWLWRVSLYGGVLMFTLAVINPILYRFGSTRGRLTAMLIILGFGGLYLAAVLGTAWQELMLGRDMERVLKLLQIAVFPVGLGALAVSWPIARHIVAKKEF